MTTTYHIALDSIMPSGTLPAEPDSNMILMDYITPEFWFAAQDSIEKLHLHNNAEFGECHAVPLVMENGNLRTFRDDIEGPMLDKWKKDNDTRILEDMNAPTYYVSLVPEGSTELKTEDTFSCPGQQEETFAAVQAIRKYSREIDDLHPVRVIPVEEDMLELFVLPDPDPNHNEIFPGLLAEFRNFAHILRDMMKNAGHKLESVLYSDIYGREVDTFFNTLMQRIHGEDHVGLTMPAFRNEVAAYARTVLESYVEVSPFVDNTSGTRNSLVSLKQTMAIHVIEAGFRAKSREHDIDDGPAPD